MFIAIEFGRFDIKFVRMISSRTLSCGIRKSLQISDDKNQKQSYNTQVKINIFNSQIE